MYIRAHASSTLALCRSFGGGDAVNRSNICTQVQESSVEPPFYFAKFGLLCLGHVFFAPKRHHSEPATESPVGKPENCLLIMAGDFLLVSKQCRHKSSNLRDKMERIERFEKTLVSISTRSRGCFETAYTTRFGGSRDSFTKPSSLR